MIGYIILFCAIGLVLGLLVPNPKRDVGIFFCISVFWIFIWGFGWAIAAFVELNAGYGIAMAVRGRLGMGIR